MAPRRGGLLEEPLTRSVIGAFYHVYNSLGFGFLEHVYSLALERELRKQGHRIIRERYVLVRYDGEPLTTQRLHIVVDDKLIVEIKSTWELHPSAERQLLNYLRATDLEVGILLHFGAKPGFHRVISTNRPRH